MLLSEMLLVAILVLIVILLTIIIRLKILLKAKDGQILQLIDDNSKINFKYKDIINIDEIKELRSHEIERLNNNINLIQADYQSKKQIFDRLLKKINSLEEQSELIEYGLYKPHFDFDTSDKYKNTLMKNYDRQRDLIKSEQAVICTTQWTVDGSKSEGKKMTRKNIKLILRAFNGECDAAISKVRWNNIDKMDERINKSFETLNVLNEVNKIYISQKYLNLKSEELFLIHELEEKKYQEKEEMRHRKEEAREEELLRKEIERAIKEAEDDEKKLSIQLKKIQKETEKASNEELAFLLEKIKLLENRIEETKKRRESAVHRRDIIKSGYIYIISNVGAFGAEVFKIGMTRRLEPLDRVRELGDASVPFPFDVHALVYSENAPELEAKIHRALESRKVN